MNAPAEQDSLIPTPSPFPGAVEPRQLPPLGKLAPLKVRDDPAEGRVEAYLAEGETLLENEKSSGNGLTAEQVGEFTTKYPWMSANSLQELGALFLDWDEDGSGEISCDEMGEMLSKVVRDLFADLDIDNSGTLGKKEIQSLCYRLGLSVSTSEVANWVEDMKIDSETPGLDISFADFQRWWNGFEDGEVSAEELQDLFDEVDEDGSGQVDIEEFINMIAMKMEGKNLEGKGRCLPQPPQPFYDSWNAIIARTGSSRRTNIAPGCYTKYRGKNINWI